MRGAVVSSNRFDYAERRSFAGLVLANGAARLVLSVGHPNVAAECFNKTVVVVLGMHRSGTSSTAGTLVRLGCGAPQHLMAPNVDNERTAWFSPAMRFALN